MRPRHSLRRKHPLHPMVRIHYRRPPDRLQVFVQKLMYEDETVRITFEPHLPLPEPKEIDGALAMEPGSPVIWFTFPGAWHDIGLFHTSDGTRTGLYANILTPPVFEDRLVWHTTDLFLDIWIPPSGPLRVLDRDQFEDAVGLGQLSDVEITGAEAEVERIMSDREEGQWPPPVVAQWDLARVRAELARTKAG